MHLHCASTASWSLSYGLSEPNMAVKRKLNVTALWIGALDHLNEQEVPRGRSTSWVEGSAWLWQDGWSELTHFYSINPLPPLPDRNHRHNHRMLCFASSPPTGCLIASTELVIRHRYPFDVWHCFWKCRLRLMSLVFVYLFSVSTRASLTACQSRSLEADLMKTSKHALAKHLSLHAPRRRDDLPLHHSTNNTQPLLWIINREARQS